MIARERHTPEHILAKLRKIEIMTAQDWAIADATGSPTTSLRWTARATGSSSQRPAPPHRRGGEKPGHRCPQPEEARVAKADVQLRWDTGGKLSVRAIGTATAQRAAITKKPVGPSLP